MLLRYLVPCEGSCELETIFVNSSQGLGRCKSFLAE